MRKWYLPLTVLGLSGLGMFIASEAGRNAVRRVVHGMDDGPEGFDQWNETAQRELDNIQAKLDQLAKSLGISPAAAQ